MKSAHLKTNIFKEPAKNKGGSEGVVLLLGGCGTGISIGRFGETFWYDWSRDRVCCAKGERIAKEQNYRLID